MRAKPNNTTGVIKMPNAGILRRKGRPPGYARNPSMVQDFAQGGARAGGTGSSGGRGKGKGKGKGNGNGKGNGSISSQTERNHTKQEELYDRVKVCFSRLHVSCGPLVRGSDMIIYPNHL